LVPTRFASSSCVISSAALCIRMARPTRCANISVNPFALSCMSGYGYTILPSLYLRNPFYVNLVLLRVSKYRIGVDGICLPCIRKGVRNTI
jgi:hypothetical protein